MLRHVVSFLKQHKKPAIIAAVAIVAIAAGLSIFIALIDSAGKEQSLAEREIERLEAMIAENPYNLDLRVELANYYAYVGRHGEAIDLLEIVLQYERNHQVALMLMGSIYMEQKRYEDALEPFLKVVELNKDNPMRALNKTLQSVQYRLGQIYMELGEPEKAIEPLKANVLAVSTDADSRYMLGRAYQALGQYNEAIELFGEAIRRDPKFEEAYEGLASCYQQLGNANGVTYAEAMIDYCSGLYSEAADALERVVAADPNFIGAQLGLGLTYEKLERSQDAMRAYEAVVVLDPDNKLAEARLKRLKGE